MSSSKRSLASRWLVAGVAIVAWLFVFDGVWTRQIIRSSESSEAGRVWRCLHASNGEIPIFGASSARAAFDPEKMQLNAFNYAMDGSSYDVIDVLLQAELRKPSTAPIIIGMSYHVFYGFGDIAKFIPYAWQPEVRTALRERGGMSWRFWVPGLRYFGYYDWYLKDYLSDRMQVTRKVVRGYEHKFNALEFDAVRFDAAVKKRLETGYGFSLDPEQHARLLQRIRSAPERKFILVYLPIHKSCFEKFSGADEFARAIQEWRHMPNVVVFDYSHQPYPDDYYTDTMHLNERGASEFSKMCGTELRSLLEAAAPRAGRVAGLPSKAPTL